MHRNRRGLGEEIGIGEGLSDLGYVGSPRMFEKRITWGSYTRVHLDRAVVDANWCSLFPAISVEHGSIAVASYHTPTCVNFSDALAARNRVRPFKYEIMWEEHVGLKPFLADRWIENAIFC